MKKPKGGIALLLAILLWMVPAIEARAAAPGQAIGVAERAMPSAMPQEATPIPGAESTPAPPVRPGFVVDSGNLYPGMERTYAQGYVPTVEQGAVTLVLPLVAREGWQGKTLRVRLGLGEGGPFATRNYEKAVELAEHEVNGGKGLVKGWCIRFTLPLLPGRVNGSYPVVVNVRAEDGMGGEMAEDFTVYVAITDGKDPNATPIPEPAATPVPEEPPVLGPKVLVQSCTVASLAEGAEQDSVDAGDRLEVRATLRNTSKTEALQNMTVTAVAPAEHFALLDSTDCRYLDSVDPDGTVEVVYRFSVSAQAPAGQYTIALQCDYAYGKGQIAAGVCNVRVDVCQPLKMEFALMRLPAEAVVADTVEVNVQAVNLSRATAYNIRATISGDGLSPASMAFIGDLEGGSAGEQPIQILITGLTEGQSRYGPTHGIVTYLYEDEAGNTFSQEEALSLTVGQPFSAQPKEKAENPGQWWGIMAAALGLMLALGGLLAGRAIRRRRG